MKLSELQNKKIVSIEEGKNIGSIIDIELSSDGKIISFFIENQKNIFSLNKEQNRRIGWDEIEKIGEDVILIKNKFI